MRRVKSVVVAVAVVVLAVPFAGADSVADKVARDQAGGGVASIGMTDKDGGDDCATAPEISLASYNDTGNTTGYTDNWGPSVSGFGQDGEDQAYKIVITTPGTIDVSVTADDSAFDHSTYLLAEADCGTYAATPLAGADSAYGGGTETFSYSAGAGTYYVIVDSYIPGEVGPFSITVTSNVPVELTKLTVE